MPSKIKKIKKINQKLKKYLMRKKKVYMYFQMIVIINIFILFIRFLTMDSTLNCDARIVIIVKEEPNMISKKVK